MEIFIINAEQVENVELDSLRERRLNNPEFREQQARNLLRLLYSHFPAIVVEEAFGMLGIDKKKTKKLMDRIYSIIGNSKYTPQGH